MSSSSCRIELETRWQRERESDRLHLGNGKSESGEVHGRNKAQDKKKSMRVHSGHGSSDIRHCTRHFVSLLLLLHTCFISIWELCSKALVTTGKSSSLERAFCVALRFACACACACVPKN